MRRWPRRRGRRFATVIHARLARFRAMLLDVVGMLDRRRAEAADAAKEKAHDAATP
jgi:hypothetical protein